uniref:Uncharacterized protein n=1 Tax=Ixodes ricinus TaxID=34613 RepID=A0A6B0USN6_IXORI
MEYWQFEVDQAVVADAVGQALAACLALLVLLAGAQLVVEHAIWDGFVQRVPLIQVFAHAVHVAQLLDVVRVEHTEAHLADLHRGVGLAKLFLHHPACWAHKGRRRSSAIRALKQQLLPIQREIGVVTALFK